MHILDMIATKRRGGELTRDAICSVVGQYVKGEVVDAQVAALLMAIAIQGCSSEETLALTEAMARSGRMLPLEQGWVDKHSTGGVGDKITLTAAPIAAAAGVKVAKLSGRALGHTGGTLDKLESIPGLTTSLAVDRFRDQVSRIGLAVAGQSDEFVPADRLIYSLRDRTGTTDVPALIAASIMSKKLAGGAGSIVLDVKMGRGSFLQTRAEAVELARIMTAIGSLSGRQTTALITVMDQPLGRAVGNSLEVAEAIEVLGGEGPEDVREIALAVATEMIALTDPGSDARSRAESALQSGRALDSLGEMIAAQGGEARVIKDPGLLPRTELVRELTAPAAGWIIGIEPRLVGGFCRVLTRSGRKWDPAPGVVFSRRVGDRVEAGETIARVHARTEYDADVGCRALGSAVAVGNEQPRLPELIVDRVVGE